MIPDIGYEFLMWEGQMPVIIPLDQEASTRKYFKLEYPGKNVILCLDSSINTNFVEFSSYYFSCGLPVPEVIQIENTKHAILQTYCGTSDLSSVTDDQLYRNYIKEAIGIIISLQKLDPLPAMASRRFDLQKLTFELDMTRKYLDWYAELYGDSFLLPEEIYRFMKKLAIDLSGNRLFVVCHRDFHSRNLLLNENHHLCMIDFQDSMMGLRGYDLVSLLYDSYRPISEEMRKEGLEYYLQHIGIDSDSFMDEYYSIAMQRAFKALGSYLMLLGERKMEKFRPSVKNCLNHLVVISNERMFPQFVRNYFTNLQDSFRDRIR